MKFKNKSDFMWRYFGVDTNEARSHPVSRVQCNVCLEVVNYERREMNEHYEDAHPHMVYDMSKVKLKTEPIKHEPRVVKRRLRRRGREVTPCRELISRGIRLRPRLKPIDYNDEHKNLFPEQPLVAYRRRVSWFSAHETDEEDQEDEE